jgi:hypothetical protein
MIKALDQTGNESENAAVIITNIGDSDFSNIVTTIDHHALGFPYDIVSGTIDGVSGNLEADTTTDFYPIDGDSALYSLDGTDSFYPAAQYAEMSYTWVHEVDPADFGAGIALEYTISGTVSIFYRPYFSSLFYTGIDSTSVYTGDDNALVFGDSQDWIPWTGMLTASTYVYEFMVVTAFGPTQGIISQLDLITDAPDIIEEFQDLVIGSAGTRLPITETYREIKSVLLTLQFDGGSAVSCKVLDKDMTSGPLIGCYNTSNALTGGTIDARIRGI